MANKTPTPKNDDAFNINDKLPWTNQGNISDFYAQVNQYVIEYTTENQSSMQDKWFNTWFCIYHENNITDKDVTFAMSAYTITGKLKMQVKDVVMKLLTLIPELEDHVNIVQISMKNGNVRYTMEPYRKGFKLPKKTTTPKVDKPATTSGFASANAFNSLRDDDDDDDVDMTVESADIGKESIEIVEETPKKATYSSLFTTPTKLTFQSKMQSFMKPTQTTAPIVEVETTSSNETSPLKDESVHTNDSKLKNTNTDNFF